MKQAITSAETLRQAAFDQVAQCRKSIEEDQINLSGLEESVRTYCLAVAALPKDQGVLHEEALQSLMLEVEALNLELKRAQDAVAVELAGLGRVKKANLAYHKSEGIGITSKPSKENKE